LIYLYNKLINALLLL